MFFRDLWVYFMVFLEKIYLYVGKFLIEGIGGRGNRAVVVVICR